MKHIKLVIIFCFFSTLLNGQTTFKNNGLFIELGGNGLFTSLNYERHFSDKPGIGMRLGIGFYSTDPFRLTFPVGVNYLMKLNNNNSLLDFGLGATYSKSDVKLYIIVDNKDPNYVNTNYINIVPSIGYRRHTSNNLMWRISFTPIINQYDFIPFLGFSIGKLF